MKHCRVVIAIMGLLFLSCHHIDHKSGAQPTPFTGADGEVRLMVLAPGHFHANLLQKRSMRQVNDSVSVYALSHDDAGVRQYLSAVESFNNRKEDPTTWKEFVYAGHDFLDKMVSDRKGNVVVLAGNNREKTEYILRAVEAGFNVLSDKPMAIDRNDFLLLEQAYVTADSLNVLLYDMMTERYDVLNIIEKALINDAGFFGELAQGTPDDPAVHMESVHHFYKELSGTPLIRPAWYYDVRQQGEGIVDVTTHLIDLLFWKCFPDRPIDYRTDITDIAATHQATDITLEQFTKSTGETAFPDYLQKYSDGSLLKVYANGSLRFNVKNHHVGLKVTWNYQAPQGGGDTFISTLKGTKALLKTLQNKEQNFVKQLYAQKAEEIDEQAFVENLQKAIGKIGAKYPFVSISPTSDKGVYLINIPLENREGHESHFKYVAESFFNYLVSRDMPPWEVPNTLAKYYITTTASSKARDPK